MKLMIICSTSFYNRLQPIIDKLESLGHKLILPNHYDGVNNEHHYEEPGEEPYIKYSCQLCEQLANKVNGLSFDDEDGKFVRFSFPK